MKHLIMGVIGHAHHGKTTLIKALTGIDTHHLKEEKERGFTVDLGFAHLALGDELDLGIIDVPGQEKYLKNMLVGANGLDLILLVIDATEAVMPQTREHLTICQLLGIKTGLVVLTKLDLLEEPEWIDLIQDEIVSLIKGTFLEGRSIIPLSSRTGEGIPELLAQLTELAKELEPKSPEGILRLPIDRVFTKRGFGTIVTGSLISGKIRAEDKVMVFPQGLRSRIRRIQVYYREVKEAAAGQHTAINLPDIEKTSLSRGDVVSYPDHLLPTCRLDATFFLLPDSLRPLKDRSWIRFYSGTREIIGQIFFLDREEVLPGEEVYAQIRLRSPGVFLPKDRYLTRSLSPIKTIGGGQILDVQPKKLRRSRVNKERVTILHEGTGEQAIQLHLQEAGFAGLGLAELRSRLGINQDELKRILYPLRDKGKLFIFDGSGDWLLHQDYYQKLLDRLVSQLKLFHTQFPLRSGISKAELGQKLAGVKEEVYLKIMEVLERKGTIVIKGGRVRLTSHKSSLSPEQLEFKKSLEWEYRAAGFRPPKIEHIIDRYPQQKPQELADLLHLLLEENVLIKLTEKITLHRDHLQRVKSLLIDWLIHKGGITLAEFRDRLNISRKYALPILEYFDRQGLTRRIGDRRVLAKETPVGCRYE